MSRRLQKSIFALVAALIMAGLAGGGVVQKSTTTGTSAILDVAPDVWYLVTKVVDGDTIDVSIDGSTTRVRLIGLDTPEIVDPRKTVQCFAKQASDEAKKVLTGQSVRLETDPSQDLHDKYGRLLAYVYAPADVDPKGILFNKYMISEGYGHEYTYDRPYKYQKEFRAAETAARVGQKGLWSPTTCNGDTRKQAP